MEGKITLPRLAERQNLLAPDWLSAPFLHLVVCSKIWNAQSIQILTFKAAFFVEKHEIKR